MIDYQVNSAFQCEFSDFPRVEYSARPHKTVEFFLQTARYSEHTQTDYAPCKIIQIHRTTQFTFSGSPHAAVELFGFTTAIVLTFRQTARQSGIIFQMYHTLKCSFSGSHTIYWNFWVHRTLYYIFSGTQSARFNGIVRVDHTPY